MHAGPSLSVVIPVHNAAATLQVQLEAVVASIDEDMEVVVVDNRSTDASRSIADAMAAINAQVRVVDADARPGEPHARNVGVAAARSDAIAFCDADDVVSPGWAVAMRAALEQAGYVTGPVDLDRLNPPWLADVRGRRIFSEMPTTVKGIPFAHGCNIGVRRETVECVGGFDEAVRIGADIDFAIRAWQAGVVLHWTDAAVVHYRHRTQARERWRQAVSYGRAAHHLHCLADEPWRLGHRVRRQARRFVWLVTSVPSLSNRRRRSQWLWTLGVALGEIRGGAC